MNGGGARDSLRTKIWKYFLKQEQRMLLATAWNMLIVSQNEEMDKIREYNFFSRRIVYRMTNNV